MVLDSKVEFWRDSRMPYVETRRACHSRICYKSHSHPTFSIGAVEQGFSLFSSSFADSQRITTGNLVVIPAHVEHSCNPLPEHDWSYQMMHLNAEWLAQLIQETQNSLQDDLQQKINFNLDEIALGFPQFKPNILNDPTLYQAFSNMNNVLFNSQISILEKEKQLIETLVNLLLPNFTWNKIEVSHFSQQYFYRLIDCLTLSIENLSLDELAQQMDMSRYALIRLFKQYFGQTPHAYQLNKKVNYARQFLKKGSDIAQLAHELEFTDQSHFHRVFKQHTGVTPKKFAKIKN